MYYIIRERDQIHIINYRGHESSTFSKPNFMKNKNARINDLMERISLDFSLLESAGINIRSSLHSGLLTTFLNISLNCLPAPKK